MYYKGGVYSGEGCKPNSPPNHAALLYGYDLTAPEPYFLFKNNWGTKWGEKGYYKVKIGEISDENDGLCLIGSTKYNTFPILA